MHYYFHFHLSIVCRRCYRSGILVSSNVDVDVDGHTMSCLSPRDSCRYKEAGTGASCLLYLYRRPEAMCLREKDTTKCFRSLDDDISSCRQQSFKVPVGRQVLIVSQKSDRTGSPSFINQPLYLCTSYLRLTLPFTFNCESHHIIIIQHPTLPTTSQSWPAVHLAVCHHQGRTSLSQ